MPIPRESISMNQLDDGQSTGKQPPKSTDDPAGERHHCRLALDRSIWNRLMREAASLKVSVTERIRQRLREAVLGEAAAMGSEGHPESMLGAMVIRSPDDATEPKSIAMLEL